MNHSAKRKNYRGVLYWSPGQVRVWINGKLLDMGSQSLAKCRVVAENLELEVVIKNSRFPPPPPALVVRSSERLDLRDSAIEEAEH